MNVLCNAAFAAGKGADGADKNETVAVSDSAATGSYTGNDGDDGASGRTGESGGNGGKTVIELTSSENMSNAISFAATGGKGGKGQTDIDYNGKGYGGNGGAGGAATVDLIVSGADITHAAVSLTATGGAGNFAGNGNAYPNKDIFSDETGSNGGDGGRAEASITVSGQKYTAADITLSANGGAGSNDDSYNYGTSTNESSGNKLVADAEGNIAKIGGGGAGGSAAATGFVLGAGSSLVESVNAADVVITATGGKGGNNTANSNYTTSATGGIGGAAAAYGSKAAKAKAYGIYAESGAVVNLSAKSTGTIKIGAKAANATNIEAYAVYADNATVLFSDNAELNTSDGVSTTDNNVRTYLKDATLGFGGTAANRTVIGGTLELKGSNTFRVNTDLAAGTADKFTFDNLATGSSRATQYITVGYDAALDPYKEGSIEANGGTPIDVLEITNLNGQYLKNFTGGTTTLDSVIYQFNTTTDVQLTGNKVQITGVATTKTPFASESVKTASDAQMALGSMWRIEGNNLMKRMGELRSDKEAAKGGVWARYYRGELSADSAYDHNFSQDYTAFQGGIDKVQDYKGGKLYTGIAVNRIDSNAGYTAGSGDLSSTGVGIYTSWLGSKGHYVDVIARGSKLSSDFKLVDLSGNSAKADYDTWAYGISAEYGYRQNLNAGWFIEPQAELSLGHIGSAGYEMSNGARIENEGVDSAVVRLGFLGGKEFTIGGRTSNAYVKASALHDFGGNGGATAYYETDSLIMQTGDLTGTWYEIGLGANLGIAKNSNLYFDALKTFGGDLRTDWQFNAGLRFSF